MKKITSVLALFLIVTSCGVKQTRALLTSGDYDAAIRNAVDGLRGNKNAKGKQDYVYMLEEAFAKVKERDLRDINSWFKDTNPQNLEKITKDVAPKYLDWVGKVIDEINFDETFIDVIDFENNSKKLE